MTAAAAAARPLGNRDRSLQLGQPSEARDDRGVAVCQDWKCRCAQLTVSLLPRLAASPATASIALPCQRRVTLLGCGYEMHAGTFRTATAATAPSAAVTRGVSGAPRRSMTTSIIHSGAPPKTIKARHNHSCAGARLGAPGLLHSLAAPVAREPNHTVAITMGRKSTRFERPGTVEAKAAKADAAAVATAAPCATRNGQPCVLLAAMSARDVVKKARAATYPPATSSHRAALAHGAGSDDVGRRSRARSSINRSVLTRVSYLL
jgi:hypothetical protein